MPRPTPASRSAVPSHGLVHTDRNSPGTAAAAISSRPWREIPGRLNATATAASTPSVTSTLAAPPRNPRSSATPPTTAKATMAPGRSIVRDGVDRSGARGGPASSERVGIGAVEEEDMWAPKSVVGAGADGCLQVGIGADRRRNGTDRAGRDPTGWAGCSRG